MLSKQKMIKISIWSLNLWVQLLLKLPIQFDREITKIVSLKLLPVHKKLNSLGLAFVWQYLFSKFLNAACML
jgi:hypothetical protein